MGERRAKKRANLTKREALKACGSNHQRAFCAG